jgi:branched-chain amino acid transport system substrate-binding protein
MHHLFRYGIGLLAVMFAASAAQADTIRFGAVLPLSGPAVMIGRQQMQGIQFAVDRANAAGGLRGNKIEIVFQDGQGKSRQSIAGFDKLAGQQMPVIFTACSGPTLAMAPLATRRKILLVNAGAQADKLTTASPYLVNTLPTFGDEVRLISPYLISQGKTRGAILFQNDADGIAERNAFEKYFLEAGGTILSLDATRFGQIDFRPSLLKLAAAKPDVVLVAITEDLLPMAQQYKKLGLGFTVAGTMRAGDPGTIGDGSTEGFLHTRIDTSPEIAAEFRAKFGENMSFFVRQYYNAAQIVLAVTDKVLADGKPVTADTMRDTLFAIRKFQGLIPLVFDSNTATVPLDISIIKDGKDVTVRPFRGD